MGWDDYGRILVNRKPIKVLDCKPAFGMMENIDPTFPQVPYMRVCMQIWSVYLLPFTCEVFPDLFVVFFLDGTEPML